MVISFLVVVTRFSRYFRALLLSHSLTLGLILVLSLVNGHLLALLPGYRVTHLSGHLPLYLVLSLVDGHLLALLLVLVLCDLLVFSLAFLFVLSMTFLFRYTV